MEKLLTIDPYNSNDKKKVEAFEEEQGLGNIVSSALDSITSSFSEEEYQNMKNHSNTIEEYLAVLEGESIKDLYLIQGEKDRKTCQVSMIGKPKKRKMIIIITEYILNRLKMLEVFIKVNTSEKEMIKYLKSLGYENLGEEQETTIFLKEKSEKGITNNPNYETAR